MKIDIIGGLICAGIIALPAIATLIICGMGCFIYNLFHKKRIMVKKKLCELFKNFIKRNNSLPRYDAIYGKLLSWNLWSLHKYKRHSIRTGESYEYYEATFCSVDEEQRMASMSDSLGLYKIYSNHIYKIKLFVDEYNRLVENKLDSDCIMSKLEKCNVYSGSL